MLHISVYIKKKCSLNTSHESSHTFTSLFCTFVKIVDAIIGQDIEVLEFLLYIFFMPLLFLWYEMQRMKWKVYITSIQIIYSTST